MADLRGTPQKAEPADGGKGHARTQPLRRGAPAPPQGRLPWPIRAAAALLPVVFVATAGSVATRPAIPTWYAKLEKPFFTPPDWLFAPAWTLLYAAMAIAAWRILSLDPAVPGRTRALGLYHAQLALNLAWPYAFFAARSPLAGLIVILALAALIAATLRALLPLDRVAAALLVPYLAWVAYAAALNLAILALN